MKGRKANGKGNSIRKCHRITDGTHDLNESATQIENEDKSQNTREAVRIKQRKNLPPLYSYPLNISCTGQEWSPFAWVPLLRGGKSAFLCLGFSVSLTASSLALFIWQLWL